MTAFPNNKEGKRLHKIAIHKSSTRKAVSKLLALKEISLSTPLVYSSCIYCR